MHRYTLGDSWRTEGLKDWRTEGLRDWRIKGLRTEDVRRSGVQLFHSSITLLFCCSIILLLCCSPTWFRFSRSCPISPGVSAQCLLPALDSKRWEHLTSPKLRYGTGTILAKSVLTAEISACWLYLNDWTGLPYLIPVVDISLSSNKMAKNINSL